MFLAEVIGHVVATKKDESMVGQKLLILRPKLVDEDDPLNLHGVGGEAARRGARKHH